MKKILSVLMLVFLVACPVFAGHRDCMDYCGDNSLCRQWIETTHNWNDGCTNFGYEAEAPMGGHCETTYDPQRKYTFSTLHCSEATKVCTVKGVLQCPKNSGGWQNNPIDVLCEPKTIGGQLSPPYVFVDRDEASCTWEDGSEFRTRCHDNGSGGLMTEYVP